MLSAEGEGKNVTLKATGVNLTPLAVFLGKLYNMGAVSDKIYIYIYWQAQADESLIESRCTGERIFGFRRR